MSVLRLKEKLADRACLLLLASFSFLVLLTIFLYYNQPPDTSNYLFEKKPNVSKATQSVTIFQPGLRDCDFTEMLRVQNSDNITICTYGTKVDLFMSRHVQAITMWEFEHIKEIQFLFEEDERQTLNRTLHGRKSNPTNSGKALSREGSSPAGDQALSMLDLGCHIGVYTLSVAKMGYQVLAVDAMQESLQLLATSLRMNHLDDRVTLLHKALSDVQVTSDNIKPDDRSNEITNETQRATVLAICLDDLIQYVRTGRVLIKMDSETLEAKALHCATLFFTMIDVPYILIEMAHHKQNFNGSYIIDFFTSRGYWPYANPYRNASLTLVQYPTWPGIVFWMQKQ